MNSRLSITVPLAALISCGYFLYTKYFPPAPPVKIDQTPIVLWHGMGDACCFPFSLGSIKKVLQGKIDGVYVKFLEIGGNIINDYKSGFFIHPNKQMIVTDSGLKLKCQLKHMGRHRITIGTCIALGSLMQMGFARDHFTHVLIDEAGQCIETENMIPISLVNQQSGQVILVGDPLQLGPIILNKYAAEKGLDISFLQRILARMPYKKDIERFPDCGYDPRLVTKLIYNYRAVPSVLKLYNDLFYDSELRAMINQDSSKEIKILRMLLEILPLSKTRSPTHGVFFFGVRGENKQENDSPSWFNPAEAKSIFLFVLKLYKKNIGSTSIGIITPYQKQVKAIRNIFIEADIKLRKIGSVEEFQGQERDIILISTVRSRKSLIETDVLHSLGFVRSDKRLNVAISRARALLIIFGNPHLLRLDKNWEQVLKYCISNDAYTGCDLPVELM